jgi:hypothetical protein
MIILCSTVDPRLRHHMRCIKVGSFYSLDQIWLHGSVVVNWGFRSRFHDIILRVRISNRFLIFFLKRKVPKWVPESFSQVIRHQFEEKVNLVSIYRITICIRLPLFYLHPEVDFVFLSKRELCSCIFLVENETF